VLTRRLTYPDGSLRTRRVVVLGIGLLVVAMFGTLVVTLTPRVSNNDIIRTLFVIGAVFGLKFPLIALLWWLIRRNKEWPGMPVNWNPDETREILAYLEQQATDAVTRPDAAERLVYLSGEAWNVADNLRGEAKVDALTVALRIDERAGRIRAGDMDAG
jgi:hypothetical protein